MLMGPIGIVTVEYSAPMSTIKVVCQPPTDILSMGSQGFLGVLVSPIPIWLSSVQVGLHLLAPVDILAVGNGVQQF